jgi:hypothetical protein
MSFPGAKHTSLFGQSVGEERKVFSRLTPAEGKLLEQVEHFKLVLVLVMMLVLVMVLMLAMVMLLLLVFVLVLMLVLVTLAMGLVMLLVLVLMLVLVFASGDKTSEVHCIKLFKS